MNLKLSGKPFPLMKSIILILSIMILAGFTKYRTENRKNSTLYSEYSRNMRNCKNSRNNLTCDISNATRLPGLSLLSKPEHLQSIIAGIVFDKMLKKIKGGRDTGLAHHLDHSPPLAIKCMKNIRAEMVN